MKKFLSTTRESSRRTLRIKKRIGMLVIVAVTATVLLWLMASLFAGLSALVATPIQATKTWLFESTGSLPSYLRDRNELLTKIQHLEQELMTTDGSGHQIKLLEQENAELRALLGDEREERTLAGVIARPGKLPYDVLMIDKGTADGVEVNMPIYIGTDRVIGSVTKVFKNSALVELVTTPGFVSSVFVIGPDIYTNAVGVGSGQLRIGVPQGIDLAVGDSVILPAADRGVFGTISHIESSPTQPEQYAFVATDVPIQSLHFVAIGAKPLSEVSFEEAQQTVAESLKTLFAVPVPDGMLVVPETATTSTTTSSSTDINTNIQTGTTSDAVDDTEV